MFGAPKSSKREAQSRANPNRQEDLIEQAYLDKASTKMMQTKLGFDSLSS